MKTSLMILIGMSAAGSAALAASATSTDRAFVAKVSQGGMFEVAAGKLASSKGSTQDVRDFAVAEVHDHMLVGAKLKAISARAGIAINSDANADLSAKLGVLRGLTGAAFDAAYLKAMADLHDVDGAAFASEAKTGGTAAYRAFAGETHRIVERHIGAIHALPLD